MSLLVLMKGQPLTYNKDNQEDKEPLFDTVDTLADSLAIMADLVAQRHPRRRERMRAAAREGFATATDLADYLVRRGLPFRDAHEAVARAVRHAEGKGLRPVRPSAGRTARVFAAGRATTCSRVLTLEGSVGSRNHPGRHRARAGARGHRRGPEGAAAQMNSVDAAGHDWLGYLAGALTTIAFVPQVLRIVRTRSAHDISWGMFGILSAGVGAMALVRHSAWRRCRSLPPMP